MKLTITSDNGDPLRIEVQGQVTQRELSLVRDPLGDLIGPEGFARKAVLNMSNVTYLDSSGVGWLLSCHKRFRQEGGQLVLQGLTPVVLNVIRVLRLDKVFNIVHEETPQEAKTVGGGAA